MTDWWDDLIPPPPPADSARTAQLGQIAAWRRSLPVPQVPPPTGPTWDDAVEELEQALYDEDPHRWDMALKLAWATGKLEGILGLLADWPVPRSPR